MFGTKQSQSQRQSEAAKAVDTVKVNSQILLQANGNNTKKELIGSIDQGTSSSRFLLFTREGKIAAWAQKETTQIFPTGKGREGWHEHDPMEIWKTVVSCIRAVVDALDREVQKHNSRILSGYDIVAIGITNQRETTVAWNADTGRVYYNAIVWDDTRTVAIASEIARGDDDRLREKTGLPLASYFAGTKVRWLLDNVQSLREDLSATPNSVRFGTIDTWLLYQLTGAPKQGSNSNSGSSNVGGLFATDVSNASRWLFLDIHTVEWDEALVEAVCGPHKVPLTVLPKIMASSEVYAKLKTESTGIDKLKGVPVSAILGDQQAALFGQVAFEPGEAKNTYGTGMFLMMNTGTKLVPSTHGLLTTIAYKVNDTVVYALEGSVSHSGSTIQWLRDQLGILKTASDSETLATDHNDGLYLVPAFAGLFAPHWRPDARGCVVGITASHHKGHFARAALEAAAYQARELFEAIEADSGVVLSALKVDGGGSHNKLLMQFQADMIDAPVVIPEVQETTAMGAAFAAGLAVGVWKDQREIRSLWRESRSFAPGMLPETRQTNWAGWKKAIQRSLDWVETASPRGESSDDDNSDGDGDDNNNGDGDGDSDGNSIVDTEIDTNTNSSSSSSPPRENAGSKGVSLALVAVLGGAVGFLLGRQKR